jgi:SAM-dependent methyltransferase
MPQKWDKAASLRREQIESGLDITFNRVFAPYFVERIFERAPKRVLEVGCGTGHLALRLASVVSHVEALEPSPGMYSIAREVLANSNVELHHSTIEEFRRSKRFDFVVSHLCGHAVADIDVFCRACSAFVNVRGLFVFSLPHPCFWNDYKEFFPRADYRYGTEKFASVALTITNDPNRPIDGLPFYHRPLGRYVSALNKCGMAVTHLDEIIPPKAVQRLYGVEWRFPRYCVIWAKRTR